jgi:hypothetical protein
MSANRTQNEGESGGGNISTAHKYFHRKTLNLGSNPNCAIGETIILDISLVANQCRTNRLLSASREVS